MINQLNADTFRLYQNGINLMIKTMLFAGFIVLSTASFSQSKSYGLTFNHDALLVADLEISAKFYEEVLGLQNVKNRTDNPERRWYSLGDKLELHLILGNSKKIKTTKSVHFALDAPDFDGFLKNVQTNNIPYSSWEGEITK
ncbi:MAG: VOC family protein [Bacteroidetes bacterium]|nr:VOC family protein [Bacteroidota bacterium]